MLRTFCSAHSAPHILLRTFRKYHNMAGTRDLKTVLRQQRRGLCNVTSIHTRSTRRRSTSYSVSGQEDTSITPQVDPRPHSNTKPKHTAHAQKQQHRPRTQHLVLCQQPMYHSPRRPLHGQCQAEYHRARHGVHFFTAIFLHGWRLISRLVAVKSPPKPSRQ